MPREEEAEAEAAVGAATAAAVASAAAASLVSLLAGIRSVYLSRRGVILASIALAQRSPHACPFPCSYWNERTLTQVGAGQEHEQEQEHLAPHSSSLATNEVSKA